MHALRQRTQLRDRCFAAIKLDWYHIYIYYRAFVHLCVLRVDLTWCMSMASKAWFCVVWSRVPVCREQLQLVVLPEMAVVHDGVVHEIIGF